MSDQPNLCLLCGEPPEVMAVFVPKNPEEFGAPPGGDYVLYALCGGCADRPDRAEAAENRLLQESMAGEAIH